MTKKILEICCYSVESAILAEQSGADRVELCGSYPEGGTTPSYGAIQHAVETLEIPVNVIVRPRGGDFLYSSVEYEIMKKDVATIKKMGGNGVVIGFLNPDGDIDLDRTREMVELSKPLEVTFHRAFDMCRNPLSGLEQLKETGVKRILTSGARKSAMEGIDLLSELVQNAGDEISIMPGCGVSDKTLEEIMVATKAWEFHSAAQTFTESRMEFVNSHVSMGGIEGVNEYKTVTVDTDQINSMVKILKSA